MMADGSPLKQTALPFEEGDASHAERWNDLVLALSRIGSQCDLHMATFIKWVFNATSGGTHGELRKSYAKLGERPLGLCCSREKARSTVEQAEKLGLVLVSRNRRYDGAQQDNGYAIDWTGVRRWKLGRTDTATDHGAGPTDHAPGLPWDQFKEYKVLVKYKSRTGPEAGPNPTESDSIEKKPNALAAKLVADSPILAEASTRRIAPKPAGGLSHGIFARTVFSEADLRQLSRMVVWHRQQLSSPMPAMGDTEADLLLTLAAALYAREIPQAEVRSSRVGAFINAITRKQWEHVVPYVPKARKALDEIIRSTGAAWVGLQEEQCPPAIAVMETT